ncbi:unnamed protein product [Agarophyton chilense]
MPAFASLTSALPRLLDSGAHAVSLRQLLTAAVSPRHALMHPALPPLAIVLYLLSIPVLSALCKRLDTSGKSRPFRLFALTHNVLLTLYSFFTARLIIPATLSHLTHRGVHSLYCSTAFWHSGLSELGFLFYISKYVELIDTYLLIIKRRPPSFLQVYHHALTIYCAYWLQLSHTSVTFLFVSLNASVHAVMYAYYALATLSIRFPLKNLITLMQMVQFVIGVLLASPMFFLQNGRCASPSQKFALLAIILHAVYLLFLFAKFYIQTYNTKPSKSKRA